MPVEIELLPTLIPTQQTDVGSCPDRSRAVFNKTINSKTWRADGYRQRHFLRLMLPCLPKKNATFSAQPQALLTVYIHRLNVVFCSDTVFKYQLLMLKLGAACR